MGKASRAKAERRARPPGELEQRLRSQLRFLECSAAAFDDGQEDEAVRMAAAARIICSDAGGTSLLVRSRLHKIDFLSTADDVVADKDLGGITRTRVAMFGSTLTTVRLENDRTRFEAPLDDPNVTETWMRFSQWWRQPVLTGDPVRLMNPAARKPATRRDLVTWLANTDGGAHVDGGLDPEYDDLLRNPPPIQFNVGGNDQPLGSPIPSSMRQVAYEILRSLELWRGTHGVD